MRPLTCFPVAAIKPDYSPERLPVHFLDPIHRVGFIPVWEDITKTLEAEFDPKHTSSHH